MHEVSEVESILDSVKNRCGEGVAVPVEVGYHGEDDSKSSEKFS
jgi:hypothetical protein